MISIQTAGINDIDSIQSLAYRTWRISYTEMIAPEQMDYMLNLMYSHESLQYQLEKQQHTFIIAYDDDIPVGFAAYFPKYDIAPAIVRLDKLYVLPDQHGKGIGQLMIDYIIEKAKPNANIIELNVNRNNKAISFYQKLGFVIVKEVDQPIGEGYFMNDYIMRKSLTS